MSLLMNHEGWSKIQWQKSSSERVFSVGQIYKKGGKGNHSADDTNENRRSSDAIIQIY